MQSEGRVLAVHCDWEHWRQHAKQFPSAPTLKRCSSLTFASDYAERSPSSDNSSDGDSVDSGRESVASPFVGCPDTKRSTESQQCAEETAFVLSSHNLPSVSSSGISIEDGDEDVDTTLGFIHQHWLSPAPEAVFATTDDTHPSHSDEHDEERRKPYSCRQQVGTTATGFDRWCEPIMNRMQVEVPALHKATTTQKLKQYLTDPRVEANKIVRYDTPIHAFIRKKLSERTEMIVNLVTSGRGADINFPNENGNSPLHLAAELHDRLCVKLLLALGANPLALNYHNQTPIEVATCDKVQAILGLKLKEQEAPEPRKTYPDIKPGSRILVLDGGGIRGLAQIEMLMELERRTGQKIVDMFDWIVGTSTGGIVALGLVYAKKELSEIRDLYFQVKDLIFQGGFRIVQNTWAMSNIAQSWFGIHQRMDSVRHPRVLISAVDLSTAKPSVVFFNNFDWTQERRHLLRAHVWEVARATSAAPAVFMSVNKTYVDGGLKANNPSVYAWQEIVEYHSRSNKEMPHISLVVSVGTGISPTREGVRFEGGVWEVFTVMKLLDVLKRSMSDSEEVAGTFDTQCSQLKIPHFRLTPKLSEHIKATETNTFKLINMLYDTRCYLHDQDEKLLKRITEAFEKLKQFPT